MRGLKTGGRQKAVPNKRTVLALERLQELGVDPLEELVLIARDAGTPVEVCARIWIELAQFIYPKRKAVDLQAVNASGVSLIQVHWGRPDDEPKPASVNGGTVRRIPADLPATN